MYLHHFCLPDLTFGLWSKHIFILLMFSMNRWINAWIMEQRSHWVLQVVALYVCTCVACAEESITVWSTRDNKYHNMSDLMTALGVCMCVSFCVKAYVNSCTVWGCVRAVFVQTWVSHVWRQRWFRQTCHMYLTHQTCHLVVAVSWMGYLCIVSVLQKSTEPQKVYYSPQEFISFALVFM